MLKERGSEWDKIILAEGNSPRQRLSSVKRGEMSTFWAILDAALRVTRLKGSRFTKHLAKVMKTLLKMMMKNARD